jgi:uncharacterized UPF0160 family protein
MIGELWWNRLVNSVRFLDDIQIAVMNEKSVVLFFDDEIPWQDIMIEKEKAGSITIGASFQIHYNLCRIAAGRSERRPQAESVECI